MFHRLYKNSLFHAHVRLAQRTIIIQALQEHRGSRSDAARFLGIHRGYLVKLIRALDIDFPPAATCCRCQSEEGCEFHGGRNS